MEIEVIEMPVVETLWVIDEHQVSNAVPLTTSATTEKKSEIESAEIQAVEEAVVEKIEFEILEAAVIHQALLVECVPITEVETVSAVVLEETEIIKSYNKKGKDEGEIQVVSTPDGDIKQIVFTKGKHKDVYNVETGLSGKEVRKLRREMKHMVKKGQVFLYSETSNVMYLMDDTIESEGVVLEENISIEDVDEMNVQAIIWKDKKHHKKK